jgi:ribonuclease HI
MGKKNIKYYAVRKGITPGIYFSWDDCKKQINKFSGAEFKSFNNIFDAEEYINMDNNTEKQNNKIKETYAYISGCFNNSCQRYGYAGLIFHEGEKYIIKGNGDEPNLIKMGSVGSQILASKETIKKAIELEIRNIDIYYDYDGVKKWANGEWKRNLKETEDYYNFIQEIEPIININFVKNKKLLSIPERNEVVDLAKKEAHCKIEKMNKNNSDRNIDEIKNINKASKKLNKKKLRRKRNFQQFELKKLPDYIRTIFEE